MRNKYRNRLDMNKTSGNAIRFKLTNLQPALKNLQIKARGKVRNSWNKDCGAETHFCLLLQPSKILPSGSKTIWSIEKLKTIALCILASCYTQYVLLNGNSNFSLRLHHSKLFGSGYTAPVGNNCFWKWISVLVVCFYKCNCIHFVVRFFCAK